jgi:ribosomal protein S17
LEGTVMSDKMDKTAVVAVNTFKSHRNIWKSIYRQKVQGAIGKQMQDRR